MANTIATTPGVATTPTPQLAGPSNYLSVYDFSHQYEPDTFVDLYPQYGNGKLTSFCKFMGQEKPFTSDMVIWAEQGRLHQLVENVTIAVDAFDCGATKHNLRVNDIIWISDGTDQVQADVYEITDDFKFKAHNRSATGAFPFDTAVATVNLFSGSNEFAKKTENFKQGRTETPETKENYPHIIKEFYDVAKSDMAHKTWLSAPNAGQDRWFVYEWERTRIRFENLIEITNVFGTRAVAGSASATAGKKGMNGVVPQVKTGGNVGNGNITDLSDIDDWTKRLRKQGKVNSFTLWNDQQQMIDLTTMLSGVNAPFSGGANYGIFDNSKDLALHLDMSSFTRNGYNFHATRFDVLDDPTLFGGAKFIDTGIGSLMVPAAETFVTENDQTVARPYLCLRNRKSAEIDRTMETKVFGLEQNPIDKDALEVHYLKEMTNQVIGANEWGVNNR